jgi:manganese/zinc/iron transport system permease protein
MSAFFANVPAMIILTGMLVGLSGALLGTFLVLRGNSLMTDAISHSVLFGIVVVWLLSGQRSGPLVLLGAVLAGLLTVAASEALARTKLVKPDTATGLIFPALFAAAVLVIGLAGRNIHIDAHAALLGEIGFVWLDVMVVFGLEIPRAIFWLSLLLAVNAGFVALAWKELKLMVFDPALAAAFGLMPGLVAAVLLALTSITAVAAFDAVGVIMFIAFIIIPAATARLLTDRLGSMLGLAMVMAASASVIGYCAAVRLDASIAGMMAVAAGAQFLVALVASPRDGLLVRHWRIKALRNRADLNTLVAHLFSHDGTPAMPVENAEPALTGHLGWSEVRAARAVNHAVTAGLVVRQGGLLRLSPAGNDRGKAIFDPLRKAGNS